MALCVKRTGIIHNGAKPSVKELSQTDGIKSANSQGVTIVLVPTSASTCHAQLRRNLLGVDVQDVTGSLFN